jgi:hypothetical protein
MIAGIDGDWTFRMAGPAGVVYAQKFLSELKIKSPTYASCGHPRLTGNSPRFSQVEVVNNATRLENL